MRSLTCTLFVLLSMAVLAGPNGRFIYHTVEKGETLYSISKQYGLKPQDVAQCNQSINGSLTIRIGQKLKIPSADVAANETVDATQPSWPIAADQQPVKSTVSNSPYHVVQKGETVFSISKAYNISQSDLISWNGLRDNGLVVGRKLLVGGLSDASPGQAEDAPVQPAPKKTKPEQPHVAKSEIEKAIKKEGYAWTLPEEAHLTTKPNVSTASAGATASASASGLADTRVIKSWKNESTSERIESYKSASKPVYDPSTDYESLYYQNVYSGMSKKMESGLAKFLADNSTTNIAYYNNASIGTILKLTNPDNGKTTYAIVVGKIPSAEDSNVLLKLSGRVARNLSAKDNSNVEIVCYTGN